VSSASKKSSATAKDSSVKAAASGKMTNPKPLPTTTVKSTPASAAPKATGAGSVLSNEARTAKGIPIPPKKGLKYSDADLKVFRSNIERAKDDALEELRMLRERLEDLTNSEANEDSSIYSMHMAEQGSEAVEKEKTYGQIQRVQDYIRKLDEAIIRIDDKTYGICHMCGILIARERLLAVPITTQSASYKIRKRCPEDGVDRIMAKSS
jgi:RNA polymerase-binding transcription factor DksA